MKNILLFLLVPLFLSPIFSQMKIEGLHNRNGLYYEINSQIPYNGKDTFHSWDTNKKMNLDFIGMDIDKDYFEFAEKRIEETLI